MDTRNEYITTFIYPLSFCVNLAQKQMNTRVGNKNKTTTTKKKNTYGRFKPVCPTATKIPAKKCYQYIIMLLNVFPEKWHLVGPLITECIPVYMLCVSIFPYIYPLYMSIRLLFSCLTWNQVYKCLKQLKKK